MKLILSCALAVPLFAAGLSPVFAGGHGCSGDCCNPAPCEEPEPYRARLYEIKAQKTEITIVEEKVVPIVTECGCGSSCGGCGSCGTGCSLQMVDVKKKEVVTLITLVPLTIELPPPSGGVPDASGRQRMGQGTYNFNFNMPAR